MPLNSVDACLLDKLKNALPASAFKDLSPAYLEEPRGRWSGRAGVLVAPDTVEDVAKIIRLANEARVAVVPYGGGTGLVGVQIASDGPLPILLSLERMNRVRAVFETENILIAEAGAILADVHEAADKVDRLYPLTIAAKGSARVGGLLATNAGGVNVLRYGNARDLCLGLEAVLPDGQIWHGLRRLRKDNMGYDLRNLLIGSEGTLGVITAASLMLHPKPAGEGTAVIAVTSPEAALQLLSMAKNHMGEGISAFELMHRMGLDFLSETMPDVKQPFADIPKWMVLIDIGLAKGLDPATALETLFVEGFEAGLVQDGVIARSEAQRAELWAVRETIPEANRR
ncbi:MAG: FAD-binding oxidoreductase, partial [Pseudomonadota bacterium]